MQECYKAIAEEATRREVLVCSRQLATIRAHLMQLRQRLPQLPEAMLALKIPPSTFEALILAIDHAAEELPEIVDVLQKASKATKRGLVKEHLATVNTFRQVRPRQRQPGLPATS